VEHDHEPADEPELEDLLRAALSYRRKCACQQNNDCQVRKYAPIHYAYLYSGMLSLIESMIWQ
jgi:hypothetical protein